MTNNVNAIGELVTAIEAAQEIQRLIDDALSPVRVRTAGWPGDYRAIIWTAMKNAVDQELKKATDEAAAGGGS